MWCDLLKFLLLQCSLGTGFGNDPPQPSLLCPLVVQQLLALVQLLPSTRDLCTQTLLLVLQMSQVCITLHQRTLLHHTVLVYHASWVVGVGHTLAAISSLSWSIWWDMIFSFLFISVISSLDSMRHMFLSAHTASYSV